MKKNILTLRKILPREILRVAKRDFLGNNLIGTPNTNGFGCMRPMTALSPR